jgi:hypothetical protein
MISKSNSKYLEVYPYSTEFSKGLKVTGIINKGESFLFTQGKWQDMTEFRDDLTERAYNQCAKETDGNKAYPPIELKKETFAVDNYPIKAILAE